jgi:uncharacterized paraquat-inducible protein A
MSWSRRVPTVRTTQCDECQHIWGIDSLDDENLDYYYCPRCGLELRKEQMYPDLYPEQASAPTPRAADER